MNVLAAIDRILNLGEAIFRYYCHSSNSWERSLTCAGPAPLEEAALEAHLRSLHYNVLYFVIAAMELGRGVVHPHSFMAAYLTASGAFPRHCDAVERIMKDPSHLARHLEDGLQRLHDAGFDANRLFAHAA
jgi:hypothetical protein